MTARLNGAVGTFLATVNKRLRRFDAIEGLMVGAIAAALALFVAQMIVRVPVWIIVIALVLPVVAAIVNVVRRDGGYDRASREAESLFPSLQNLVRTHWELSSQQSPIVGEVSDRVKAQAEARVAAVNAEDVRPAKRVAGLAAAALLSLLLMALLASRAGDPVRGSVADNLARAMGPTSARTVVTVVPPSYLGVEQAEFVDPERIEAVVGSRVSIKVASSAAVGVVHDNDTLKVAIENGSYVASTVVSRDGLLLLRLFDNDGIERAQRLIGVTAEPDAPPIARITSPARDLFLNDTLRNIDVVIDAIDDYSLQSLELRYTKVSGSGEQFTFVDGTVPLSISRTNGKQWSGRGTLSLSSLGLIRGDVVVYRAAARDNRPNAPAVESDAFIVEIVSIGSEAVEGFSIDPEQDRYAVSQQMVVLKTERLIQRKPGMDSATFLEQAREVSMEQRRVRAEFVFMMGGELAESITHENSMGDLDESHEAESESDLSAGRMQNRGRSALLAAIRSMSRAITALNVADVDRALVHEKNAVRQLEEAFTRTRYLLRAFSEREELDLARRLTGDISDASSSYRAVAAVEASEIRDAQLSVLRMLTQGSDSLTALSFAGASRTLLATDPSSESTQRIAAQLMRASESSNSLAKRAAVDSVVQELSTLLSRGTGKVRSSVGRNGASLRFRDGLLRDSHVGAAAGVSR